MNLLIQHLKNIKFKLIETTPKNIDIKSITTNLNLLKQHFKNRKNTTQRKDKKMFQFVPLGM